MHKLSSVYKLKQYKAILNKYVGGFWWERTKENELGESVIIIIIIDSFIMGVLWTPCFYGFV